MDEKIATAKFKLQTKVERNLKFYDSKVPNKEADDGFIDAKVSLKSEILAHRKFASIIKEGIKN